MTSVERLVSCAEDTPQEAAAKIENQFLPPDWPTEGVIEFRNVYMKYKTSEHPVLKDLTFTIEGKKKIGIVGRTGAGKSSIMTALLRLCDIESGRVLIDKIDTAELQRKTLRQQIAVIPQDPILFQGSVRYNLDPFDKYSDESLWDALEQSNLKNKISKLKKNLLSNVDAEGENFSVGEKQLICLTRAILRKNKILLLDEATASVDVETDALIQASIRTTFSKCTVLTIAHRLNTIANYDRVVVMSGGKVEEFDTPANLMKDKNSMFYNMMKASGIKTLDQFKPDQESVSQPVN
jgi:ABC-type multidrug transport system fused ATPase/permease subunit